MKNIKFKKKQIYFDESCRTGMVYRMITMLGVEAYLLNDNDRSMTCITITKCNRC